MLGVLKTTLSGWMEDIRANNSDAKIIPRFLFEQWSGDELKSLMVEEPTQIRCGQAIVEFLQVRLDR